MKMPTGKRILIVEDDLLISEMLLLILEQLGYTVVGKATTGNQVMDLVKQSQPDIVLMDLELSGQFDGVKAVHQIHASYPDLPVVVLTAYNSPEVMKEAEAAGAKAYLVKPATGQEVALALATALNQDADR